MVSATPRALRAFHTAHVAPHLAEACALPLSYPYFYPYPYPYPYPTPTPTPSPSPSPTPTPTPTLPLTRYGEFYPEVPKDQIATLMEDPKINQHA